MKNKILIVAMLGILSLCGCQDRSVATAPHYLINAINNTTTPFYVELYAHNVQGIFLTSDVVKPNESNVFAGLTFVKKAEDRYVFKSNVDQSVILDTTIVTDPKMPYDGVNYQINMTLNADKTITVKTIPIVFSDN